MPPPQWVLSRSPSAGPPWGAPPRFLVMAAEWGSPALSRSPGALASTSVTCLPGAPLCGSAMGGVPELPKAGAARRFRGHPALWRSPRPPPPLLGIRDGGPADRGSPATSRSPGVLAAISVTFSGGAFFCCEPQRLKHCRRAGAAGSAPGAGQALALRRASAAVCRASAALSLRDDPPLTELAQLDDVHHLLLGWRMSEVLYYAGCLRCLLYTSPSPRDRTRSRMPSSA